MARRTKFDLPAGVFILDAETNGDYLNGKKNAPPGAPGTGRTALLIALVLVVVVAVLILTGINQFGQWMLLSQRGVAAQARVTEKLTINTSGGPEFNLVYTFRANDGRDWTGTATVDAGTFNQTTTGQAINIVYLSGSPTTSRLGTLGDTLPGDLTARLAGSAAGFVAALGGLYLSGRQRRVADNARAVAGRVAGGGSGDALEYEFTSPESRKVVRGRAVLGDRVLKNVRPAPGQPVMVYYVNDANHWVL